VWETRGCPEVVVAVPSRSTGPVAQDPPSDAPGGSGRAAAKLRSHEELQDLTDGPALLDGVGDWKVALDHIAVPASYPLLDDVPGLGEVVHDGERPPLRDAERRPDVTEADIGVVGHAEQCAPIVGQESPLGVLDVKGFGSVGLSRLTGRPPSSTG
jgi:hypothetical protein